MIREINQLHQKVASLIDQLNDVENDQITEKERHKNELERFSLKCEEFKEKAKRSAQSSNRYAGLREKTVSVLSDQIKKNTGLLRELNALQRKHNHQRVQASKESKILANYRVKESKRDKYIKIFAMYPR